MVGIKNIEDLRDKYSKLYRANYSSNGGLFTPKRRRQLLGIQGKSGRDRPLKSPELSSFWYDVRETVKVGLLDLQLFIETSGEQNVGMVMTNQRLASVFKAFFFGGRLSPDNRPINEQDISSKAQVAHMLVKSGLEYLRAMSQPYLRRKEDEEIHDAIELSQQLTFNLLTDEEKHSVVWKEITRENWHDQEPAKVSEDKREM
jgi:hypothetical protein